MDTQQGDKEIQSCFAYFRYNVGEVPSETFIGINQCAKIKGMGIIVVYYVYAHQIFWGGSNINARTTTTATTEIFCKNRK